MKPGCSCCSGPLPDPKLCVMRCVSSEILPDQSSFLINVKHQPRDVQLLLINFQTGNYFIPDMIIYDNLDT